MYVVSVQGRVLTYLTLYTMSGARNKQCFRDSKYIERDLIRRYCNNPIIGIENLPFRCGDIWNAGVIKYKNEFLLLLSKALQDRITAKNPIVLIKGPKTGKGESAAITNPSRSYELTVHRPLLP